MGKQKTSRPVKGTKQARRRVGNFRIVKGAILVVAAALALGAGIFKGGEGIFFGAVFAIDCGLLGVLFLVHDGTATRGQRRH